MSTRENKKIDTRERIVRAALELFFDQGYEATSVDQIARAARTSRRTFFRYFNKKEDVVFFDEAAIFEIWQRSLAERQPNDTLVTRFRRAARQVLRFLNAENPAARVEVGVLRYQEPVLVGRLLANYENIERLIAHVAAEEYGCAATDPRAQFAAAALVGTYRKMGQIWIQFGGVGLSGTYLDTGLSMLRTGIDQPDAGTTAEVGERPTR